MNRILLQVIAGIAGLWLAIKFVPGVEFTGKIQYLLLTGAFLGLINYFIKPILKIITIPLRMLTFGLFGLIINMIVVWVVDIFFHELIIRGIIPLFWTTIIIVALSFFLGLYKPKKKNIIEEK